MPQRSNCARRYLPRNDGKSVWAIRGGKNRIGTGRGSLGREQAEKSLAAYLA
jgi:hypothetical protein